LTGLEDNTGVVSMLRRRSSDEKINVRKASLLAIEKICRLDQYNINEQVIAASTIHDSMIQNLDAVVFSV